MRHARLRVLGVSALLFFRPDTGELGRRLDAGQPPILRLGAIEAMMGLPLGVPVPEGSLTERERCLLRAAPRAALRREEGQVIRLASMPLRAELVVAEAPNWRTALRRAGRFSPTCARVAVAGRPPKDEAVAAHEADYYGIGLAVLRSGLGNGGGSGIGSGGCEGEGPVCPLVPPAPGRRLITPVTWKFAELVLGSTGTAEMAGTSSSAADLFRPHA